MKIFRSLSEIKNTEPAAIALGNFDGVHLGHQALIQEMVDLARKEGLKSAVFTFENHPRNVLAGKPVIQNLISSAEKETILRNMGVDYLFSVPFDKEISGLSPQVFTGEILRKILNAKAVFCGFNYHFGAKGSGGPEDLIAAGESLGFRVRVLPAFTVDNQVISSSLIRGLIEEGRVGECEKYLGRKFSMGGIVVTGQQLGRTIGFPTVNLAIDEALVSPANGGYITACEVEGVAYPSITSVGNKPTVGEFVKNSETHIFNFSRDIYGKEIRVEFLEYIRPEQKFPSVDALMEQIKKDCEYAVRWHEARK